MNKYNELFEGLSDERRELLEIIALFSCEIKKEKKQNGKAKHEWIFTFFDDERSIRQDRITPFTVFCLLEDHIPELNTKIMTFLRKMRDSKIKNKKVSDEI
jgi:hypothetical protein